eukprot:1196105-Prorocentrum_minimum.AAC.4
MRVSVGDAGWLQQLCLTTGFPYTSSKAEDNLGGTLARYLVGADPRLLKHYPELAYFRDIVFYFKLFMSPSADALPKVTPLNP